MLLFISNHAKNPNAQELVGLGSLLKKQLWDPLLRRKRSLLAYLSECLTVRCAATCVRVARYFLNRPLCVRLLNDGRVRTDFDELTYVTETAHTRNVCKQNAGKVNGSPDVQTNSRKSTTLLGWSCRTRIDSYVYSR